MNTVLSIRSVPNFCDEEGKAFLVKCPKCERENYGLAVATGICCWCKYDLNETKQVVL